MSRCSRHPVETKIWINAEPGFRQFLHALYGGLRDNLLQHQAFGGDIHDRKLCNNRIDHAGPGERQPTLSQNFRLSPRVVCSIATITLFALATKSMLPP